MNNDLIVEGDEHGLLRKLIELLLIRNAQYIFSYEMDRSDGFPTHYHDVDEFVILTEGEFELTTNGCSSNRRRLSVKPDSVILVGLSSLKPHMLSCKRDGSRYTVIRIREGRTVWLPPLGYRGGLAQAVSG